MQPREALEKYVGPGPLMEAMFAVSQPMSKTGRRLAFYAAGSKTFNLSAITCYWLAKKAVI